MNKKYESIIEVAAKSFNLSHERIEKLTKDKLAHILCSIPFEAASEYPEIYALKTITNYISTLNRDFLNFSSLYVNQDSNRFDFVIDSKGDRKIIDQFKEMLRTGDLIDAFKDQKEDEAQGRINPFLKKSKYEKFTIIFSQFKKTIVLHLGYQKIHSMALLFTILPTIVMMVTFGVWWGE